MGELLVRDIMVCNVVAVGPEDSVRDAAGVLLEHDVGGVPVTDGDGRVVGLLSDGDLVMRQGRLHVPTVFSFLSDRTGASSATVGVFEVELRKVFGSTVAEVMDPDPATCAEDDTVEEVATRMLELGVRRLPVVRHGRLVGIVARGDLLRLVVGEPDLDRAEVRDRTGRQ